MTSSVHLYSDIVRFEDVDAGAIVYHPRYLSFIERARGQILENHGFSFKRMLDEGLGMVIGSVNMKYIRPLELESQFFVASQVNNYGHSIINMTQVIALDNTELIRRELQNELQQITSLCFFAHIKLIIISLESKRPAAIPDWLITVLNSKD